MINKIHKIINNKFDRFIKFVFFLRSLFAIFFVAIVLFLSIPHLFDNLIKERLIMNYLSQNYGLEIIDIKNVKYKSLPTPQLQINNIKAKFHTKYENFEIKELTIYPELFSIYNYDNFQSRKIKLKNGDLEINLKDFKNFNKRIFKLKKKFSFQNISLKVTENKNEIIEIKNIQFFNYGYKKNIINGDIFNRKFKINLKDDFNKIDFKILDTGISAKLNIIEFDKGWLKDGNLRGKILKSNFKLNFRFEEDKIKIKELFFRDKELSFDTEAYIILRPFFKINSKTEIQKFHSDLLKNFDLNKFLRLKDLIKNLNIENHISFKSKKFSGDLINFLEIKTNLAYGRLLILNNFTISDSRIICEKNVNFLEEYPIIFFKCNLNSPDKRNLLKKIKINYKPKNEPLNLDFEGNVNILNNKINFDFIKTNNSYKATNEDLEYFKLTFE